jgi:hypothetical protein
MKTPLTADQKIDPWPCHRKPRRDWCDKEGTGGFMGHTCLPPAPISIPMLLWCPSCGERHIDVGEFASKVHHTHACQGCGMVWRPAVVPTFGVQYLPGFKNE